MATFSTTLGSVFDLVGQTSNAVVSTVTSVSSGAQMLNDFVNNARFKQAKRLAVELIEYDDVLLENASLDALKREEALKQYVGNDPAKQASYLEHHARIKAAIADANKPE